MDATKPPNQWHRPRPPAVYARWERRQLHRECAALEAQLTQAETTWRELRPAWHQAHAQGLACHKQLATKQARIAELDTQLALLSAPSTP